MYIKTITESDFLKTHRWFLHQAGCLADGFENRLIVIDQPKFNLLHAQFLDNLKKYQLTAKEMNDLESYAFIKRSYYKDRLDLSHHFWSNVEDVIGVMHRQVPFMTEDDRVPFFYFGGRVYEIIRKIIDDMREAKFERNNG